MPSLMLEILSCNPEITTASQWYNQMQDHMILPSSIHGAPGMKRSPFLYTCGVTVFQNKNTSSNARYGRCCLRDVQSSRGSK